MPLATTPTYPDVAKLLCQLVHRFRARYGQFADWDVDEMLADANAIYAQCCNEYDPTRGTTFPGFLYCRCWTALFTVYRRRAWEHKRRHALPPDVTVRTPAWDRETFLDRLSADAQTAVTLVLEPPPPVADAVAARGGKETRRTLLGAVRSYLRELGWCSARILESFREIREALS